MNTELSLQKLTILSKMELQKYKNTLVLHANVYDILTTIRKSSNSTETTAVVGV